MKEGRTLQELAAELDRQNETKKDYLAPVEKIRMAEGVNEPTGEVVPVLELEGSGAFGIRNLAHRQIAEHLKIPAKYYDRMRREAPDLLTKNVNEWMGRKMEEPRMIRTMDGEARAFLSNRYRPLDNLQLLQAVLPVLLGHGRFANNLEMVVRSCEVTESRLYLKVTAKNLTARINGSRQGDVVEAGICLTNSEVGLGTLRIEGLIFFLACVNGMIAADSTMRKYHIGRRQVGEAEIPVELLRDETRAADDRAFWLKAQDAVLAAFNETRFRSLVGAIEAGVARPIEKPLDKVIEIVTERNGLSEADGAGILRELAAGADLSQYGLGNAITAHSKVVKDYDAATNLERIGGEILVLPETDWQRIGAAA